MLFNDVLQKGTVIAQLHHKTIRNRTMPVVVDFDQVIAEPQRILDAGWAVPCDVVGLTSKKAKSVKVRFHPSIGELIHLDQQVATAAVKDALKYLDTLLDHSEWTRHATKSVDSRIGHLEKISHFLRMRQPALSFTSRSLDIMWSLHSESRTCNGKLDKCLTDVLCSLHNHSVATSMVARVQQMSGEGTDGGQCVEVLFEKNELLWPILRLVLGKDSDYLQTGSIRDCWQLISKDTSLRISLPRTEATAERIPVTSPHDIKCFVLDNRKEVSIMMHSCQLRVDDLRIRLDKSLAEFQRAAVQRDKARSLYIVRQSSIEAILEINRSGERARLDRLLATSPLNVVCCGTGMMAVPSSPADSTDSGVAVSPLSSPFSGGKHSPSYHYPDQNRYGMRQRSASECGDWDGIVLKSILKKPQRIDRFSRSKSESHHCAGDASQLSLLMESTTEVNESEGHTDNDCEMVVQRKKRVSFSEKVQERRFRVGQCILTAARKNEKKRAYRKRKEERQRSLSEDNDGNHINDSSATVLEEKPCLRSDRQDSGFVDGDENDCENDDRKLPSNQTLVNPEDRWKDIVRQQREVVTH